MELAYKGGNCVVISNKKDLFITDPKLSDVGLKDVSGQAAALILTQSIFGVPTTGETLVVDGPGEYEVKNCSIRGIPARRHSDLREDSKTATMYRLDLDGTSVVILGHIDPKLSEEQLEALGVVDILIIPVGGNGYTLDSKSAVQLVRKIEPKVVIPTHYAEEGLTYEVPQQPLEEFIKELGVTAEELPKLKVKAGLLPLSLTVYKLQRN